MLSRRGLRSALSTPWTTLSGTALQQRCFKGIAVDAADPGVESTIADAQRPNTAADAVNLAVTAIGQGRSDGRVSFRQLDHWNEIQSRLKALEDDIRAVEITAAINKLKNLRERPPASFLNEIQDIVERNLFEFNVRQKCDILHGCVRLPFPTSRVFTSLLRSIALRPKSLESVDNRGLATLVYAIGTARRLWSDVAAKDSSESELLVDVVRFATNEITQPYRAEYMNERTIVSFVYGLGTIPFRENPAAVQHLVKIGVELDILPLLNEQEFSMFMTALEELKVPLSPDLSTQIEREICNARRLQDLSPQGIANIMRRLRLMKFTDRNSHLSLAEEAVRPERLPRYSGQDIANLVYSFSACNLKPDRFLEPFIPFILDRKILESFKERELSCIIYAYALRPSSTRAPLFELLAREATRVERIRRHTHQGLSMMVYSMGLARCDCLTALKRLGKECIRTERIKAFDEQGLSNIIYGFGRLRTTDLQLVSIADYLLIEASEVRRLKSFAPQALANIIYSLAQLKMPHRMKPFLEEVCLPGRVSHQTDQGLTNILQSLSWLDYDSRSKTRILLEEVQKRDTQGNLSPLARSNIVAAVIGMKDQALASSYLKVMSNPERLEKQDTAALIAVLQRYARHEYLQFTVTSPMVSELCNPERLKNMTVNDLVETLELLLKLGLSSNSTVTTVVHEFMRDDRQASLHPHAMARAAITLNRLRYPGKRVLTELCGMLTKEINLNQLAGTDILAVLNSTEAAAISLEFIEVFLSSVCREEMLQQLETYRLAEILDIHVTHGVRHPDRISRCLEAMIRRQENHTLTLKDVADALGSLATLGMHDLPEITLLVEAAQNPRLLDNCRVHYLAKTIIALCRLGRPYRKAVMNFIDIIAKPPWSEQVTEKDLKDLLLVIKEVHYEYNKIGHLLNLHRRQNRESMFLEATDDSLLQSSSKMHNI